MVGVSGQAELALWVAEEVELVVEEQVELTAW